ncbi:hypothetical protein IM697_08775 [Streptomyces ferrugineus]|uniref:Uncharacterized protein n=1 Tax=Streptomyces ferrugineus TaxID=1413221 RepID=A0A7M2SQB8_9ACTN|nr:hypothetical protein [Streptomyces ferrugineus]QOV38452.1 hypothetical protein IM697_08775 [Streptomyces ferrugineus]
MRGVSTPGRSGRPGRLTGGGRPAQFAQVGAESGEGGGVAVPVADVRAQPLGLPEVVLGLGVPVLFEAQLPQSDEQQCLAGAVLGAAGGGEGRVVAAPPGARAVHEGVGGPQ